MDTTIGVASPTVADNNKILDSLTAEKSAAVLDVYNFSKGGGVYVLLRNFSSVIIMMLLFMDFIII